MAQLAVSLGSAAIGFAVGGPLGAQIGWAAGSLIGAALFAPSQQGPRLQDTKVQISSYGAAIPLPYGGFRLAGNVIWSTDLQEHSSESGGKGGPSVTSFSYTVSCAVAIADREIGGIRRIWADAKLVYDAREDADAATQVASASFAEYMTVYTGTEAQLPDPTIEAVEGSGNVEAYRGVAYVVFTNLPLGDYGNRIPNFTFETTTEAPAEVEATLLEPLRVYDWAIGDDGRPVHGVGDTLYTTGPQSLPQTSNTDFATLAALNAANYDGDYVFPVGGAGTQWVGLYRNDLSVGVYNIDADQLGVDPERLHYHLGIAPEGLWDIDDRDWNGSFLTSLSLAIGPRYLEIAGTGGGQPMVVTRVEGWHASNPHTEWPFVNNMASGISSGHDYDSYQLSYTGGYPLAELIATRVPTHAPKSCYPGNPCSAAEGAAELPGNDAFCLTCSGEVTPNYDWTIVSGTAKVLCDVEYRDGALYQNALGPVLLPGDPNYSNGTYWTAARDAAVAAGTMQADVAYPVVVSSYASGTAPPAASVAAGSMLLADIVEDICLRSGLDPADFNVDQLVDEVQGFAVTRQMPARSAIEPLRQAYWFDAVDDGEQIIFVKRGAASVATIQADDLGATEGGEPTSLVVPKRAQESELPAEVAVAYLVRDADYQTGTQQARRITTGSQQIVSLELPIVLEDDDAAGVADVLMVDAWQGRVERSFSTTRKWSRLLPTDVVTVDDGEFEYRGRLTEKIEDGPLIRWTLRDDAAATYSPSVTASPTSGGGGAIRFVGPMAIELMDIPALRDADDDAGFYAGAFSYIGSFRGGMLYKSVDDSAFAALQEMRVSATVGHATTALGTFDGGNVFDEANGVTVTIHSGGTLSSATTLQVLNGANAALLGDEVLQFRTATLVGTNTYRLSGMLRGRRGTEWAMVGHTATDRFVLLNEATIYRVLQSLPQLGEAYYRPVSYGQAVADAVSEAFSNTGAALKPLSPVHLVATPDGAELVLTWVRRTRIGGAWMDGVDAPLSEASESYRVRVFDAFGAVLEEQTVATQTATVASADAYSIEVVQLSATVGSGFPATLIL